jgi:hypothetical protein
MAPDVSPDSGPFPLQVETGQEAGVPVQAEDRLLLVTVRADAQEAVRPDFWVAQCVDLLALGSVLTRLPTVRAGVRRAFGSRGGDLALGAIEFAPWLLAQRRRGLGSTGGAGAGTAIAVPPLADLLRGLRCVVAGARFGARWPVAVVVLTAAGAVILAIGTTPLGALLCVLVPTPATSAVIVAAEIVALLLRPLCCSSPAFGGGAFA